MNAGTRPLRGRPAGPADSADESVLAWLLEGDPAIRWQVLRDLAGAAREDVERERRRVASQGWGAQLLARQDPDGRWAGALYSPKWISTTYTLLLLQRLGLPAGHPRALAGCRQIWQGAHFQDGGLTLARSVGHPEACITAMLVSLAFGFDYCDEHREGAVRWLLGQQLDDGGWNCRSVRDGSRHGSFHTSISVLEALLEYERAGGELPVEDAMRRGRRFFLDHRLYRSHRTGEVVDPALRRFPFPPQWHFDVLRGLEHFPAAGAPADPDLGEAIEVVRRARRADGAWPVYRGYSGQTWFLMEPAGPSRWNTLRAMRVLRWWEAGAASDPHQVPQVTGPAGP